MAVSPALIAEHRLIRRLRRAGAISAATAHELPELHGFERRRLEHLRDRSILVEPQPGLFYLDEAAYTQLRLRRRRRALILLGAGFVAWALLWLST